MNFRNTLRRTGGFSLIELMVVVAIVALLAGVAYPSYLEHITRAKRAEGKAALLKAAQLQERNYIAGAPSTYADTAGLAALFRPGYAGPIYSGEDPTSNRGNYTITVESTDLTQNFVLRASPNGSANFSDPKCGQLTLSNAGVQGKSGTVSIADCWNR